MERVLNFASHAANHLDSRATKAMDHHDPDQAMLHGPSQAVRGYFHFRPDQGRRFVAYRVFPPHISRSTG